MFSNILSFTMLWEIVTSGIILSLCGFELFSVEQYLSVKFLARFQFALYMVMELFILSRASENLRMESEKIAEKIYEICWYDLKENRKEFRSLMVIAMIRTKMPAKLSALGFSEISFETFVTVGNFEVAIT